MALLVCSCIPYLRNLIRSSICLSCAFCLPDKAFGSNGFHEDQGRPQPPLRPKNTIRTGLTPPSSISSPRILSAISNASTSTWEMAKSSRHMPTALPQSEPQDSQSLHSASSLPSASQTAENEMQASCTDHFPHYLPRNPRGATDTARADKWLHHSLAGDEKSESGSLGSAVS